MRVPPAVLSVALLLLLAGCVGPFGDDPSSPTAEPGTTVQTVTEATPTPAGTTEPGTGTDADPPTATPTSTASPNPDLSDDNPFGQRVVPVRVNDTVDDGRNTTRLVQRAIEYWNPRIERHTPFDYRFELADDPADARVEVRYVENIDSCGRDHDERTVGCAPLLEEGRTAPDVVVAEIEVHGANSAVTGTIQHELGHILGLRHDDEPLVVMGFQTEAPVKDASDRAVPWFRNDLSVYIDQDRKSVV